MWQLYMIRCGTGALYTGITNNLVRRVGEHVKQGQTCAKFLRGKTPLTLVYTVSAGSHGEALVLERKVKALSKARKEALVTGQKALKDLLEER